VQRLAKLKGIYFQACDQCVYMYNLARMSINEVKIGCFPDFYKAIIDQ